MKEFVYWLMKKMGCTCDKMKKSSYAWEMPDLALLNLITYEELLEDRRRVILEKFARKDEAADYDPSLVQEWLALTRQRDRVLRQKINQENERYVHDNVVCLYRWVHKLVGDRDSERCSPPDLSKSITTLWMQLRVFIFSDDEKSRIPLESSPRIHDSRRSECVPEILDYSSIVQLSKRTMLDFDDEEDQSSQPGTGYLTPVSFATSTETYNTALSAKAFRNVYQQSYANGHCHAMPNIFNFRHVAIQNRSVTDILDQTDKLDTSID